jgi:GntR family transcriptional regulator
MSLSANDSLQPLLRDSAQPLYQQLAALLARRIDDGEFASRSRLPSEPELMAAHGVSRITVRQAIALLARNGRVVAKPGKGTFVLGPMMRHDLGPLRGFYDALREQGLDPQTELLAFSPSSGRADRALPEGLDLPVSLRRRYLLDGQPFALVEAWLPAAAAALGDKRAARLTVYEILEKFLGERIAGADVSIRCQPAPRDIAGHLGLRSAAAVLVMERRSHARSGRVLEFMRIHIVPERYEFRLGVSGPLEIANALRPVSTDKSQSVHTPLGGKARSPKGAAR